VLGQPIGKQDQYAAAFGGLNLFTFKPDGGVTVEPQRLANGAVAGLFERIMMFWTGHQRRTEAVLGEQKANTANKFDSLVRMRDQAHELQAKTCNGHIDTIGLGQVLDEGWPALSPTPRSTTGTSWPRRPARGVARSWARAAAASCCSSSSPIGRTQCAVP
jgi:galactokinase/mevalonate kinase-like predicted kinase